MKTNRIGIIIGREYMNRVKKKSFLVITFLVPILFAAVCTLPSLIMFAVKEDSKAVAVIDDSGIVMPFMTDSETLNFTDCNNESLDELKSNLAALGYDAVLHVSPLDSVSMNVSAEIYSAKPLGIDTSEGINNRLNSAVEDYRVNSYGIEGLPEIVKSLKANVRMVAFTIGEDGQDKASAAEVSLLVSMVLGMLIFTFISMFGGMVMSAVIEEKSSRVVEVLISSVKASELMFGKIIGVALVALTQFFLWIVLSIVVIAIVFAISGPALLGEVNPADVMQFGGTDAEAVLSAMSSSPELSAIMNIPFGRILICFIVFFIFGYLLYASLYAAIGSAVENEGDSNQLQMPLTIPLMLGFFISIYAAKAPDSALVFWTSMIPFTSPIVMLARIPYGVEVWEIILSVAILIGTFVFFAWFSSKVYRIGILMFGTKSTWKDLFRWFRQK